MGRTIERPAVPRAATTRPSRTTLALAGVATALVVVSVWGYGLRARGVQLHLGVIPLFGAFRFRPTIGVASTVTVAAVIVTVGPRLAATLPFRRLLAAACATAAAWAVALATTTERLLSPST